MLNFPPFPLNMFNPNLLPNPIAGGAAAAGGWHGGSPAGGDDRGGGPMRRGGAMGGGAGSRYQNRPGPYDRRQNPRWGAGSAMDMNVGGTPGGRGRPPTNRWGDGGAGGQAIGPREAVQGRTIKSYEDLDQVGGGGDGGELNY